MNETTELLFGHTDETTAYVVDDYPFGYKLKCSIRYWIETDAKRGAATVTTLATQGREF